MKKSLSLAVILSLFFEPLAYSNAVYTSMDRMKNSSAVTRTSTTKRILQAGYGSALTFSKDYSIGRSIDADYALGSKTGTLTCTRVGAGISPGTYIDSSGTIQLQAASNNTARFTSGLYGSTGFISSRGVIVEDARANLVIDSYFSIGTADYWIPLGTGAISTSTTYANPYGGGQVLKFVGSANLDRFVVSDTKTFSTTAGTIYAVSALVRGSGTIKCRFVDGLNTASYGTTTYALSDKWILIKDSFTSAETGAQAKIGFAQVGATNVTAYFSYIQYEVGFHPSSMIPTTTASLTRNKDLWTYLNSGNRTQASESVIVEFTPISTFSSTDTNRRVIIDSDADKRSIQKDGSSATTYAYPNATDNVLVKVGSETIIEENIKHTLGATFLQDASPISRIFIDGFKESYDVTDAWTTPAQGEKFYIGSRNDGTSQINAIINSVAFFNRDLTEDEMYSIPVGNRPTVYVNLDNSRPSYTDSNTILDDLIAKNHAGWQGVVFGKSEQNRDIRGIVITPASYTQTILFTSGLHGGPATAAEDEAASIKAVLALLQYIDADTTRFSNYRLVFCPILNPDGVVAETRKNNNTNDGRAVDINRNFTEGWGGAATAPYIQGSADPASANYKGPAAESEAETVVFKSIVTTYTPTLSFDVHCTWNRMGGAAALGSTRQTQISSYFRSNGYSRFPNSYIAVNPQMGLLTDYAAAQGVEAYALELLNSNNKREANRFIAGMQFLIDEGI